MELYATPTVPAGNDNVVMVKVPTTLRVNFASVESAPFGAVEESVTLRVNVDVPPVVGDPKMVPALLMDNPAGSDPLAKLHFRGSTPPTAWREAL